MAKVAVNTGSIKVASQKTLGAILRETYADGMFESDIGIGVFKTGFPTLDYGLAFPVDIYKDDVWVRRDIHKGILMGSYMMIVGDSGTGKTTLGIQIASNIIRPYEHGVVYHFDLERACTNTRVMTTSRLPRSDFDIRNPNHRYILNQAPHDHEDIQRTILRIYREKMANADKYRITLDQCTEYGDPIVTMQPTVVLIDSIPMIGSTLELGNTKDEKKMEQALTQMDAAQSAGAFKRLIKMVLGPMKQANIILIGISHIGTKISSNPMIHNKKDFRAMGQDEIIAGGKMNTYGATNIIRIDRKSGKGYTTVDGDGFNGFDSVITIVKSRTTFDAKIVPMIYDCENGFDSIRSMIQYAIARGIITGNRASMKFTAEPDFKFTTTSLYKDIKANPRILECLAKYIIPDLESGFKVDGPPDNIMSVFVDY